MDVLCTADLCPVILNATCVFYEGGTLMYTGITTNDSVQTALQKIDAKFGDAMVGYTFTNGVYQSVAGAPVGLGGNLTANTSIGGNFTLTFAGNLQATKHITTGGTASQFVKGDGTLDSTAYQAAGNYITALTGDVIANGPGSINASLAVVNSNPGTYGSGTRIPVVTVDTKGRVTALTTTAINVPSGSLSFVGDVYGSGVTGSQTTLTLSDVNTNVYAVNSFLKFKVNAKGLVTGAAPITHVDIEGVLGYVPVPETRTISINGVTHDLQSNISWTIATGVSGVTASAPLASSGGATPNISIPKADATNDGYLDNVDWVTFNNKVPTSRTLSINGTSYDLSADRSWTINSMVYPGAGIAVSTGIGWTTSLVDNSANWNTAYAERISSASAPLSIGSNIISISQANASTNGYLSSTDWTTFNNKQTAGDYITALTGEATATGPGSATVTLSTPAVTGKLLTGVNITGGSVVATDSILTAFGKVQNQINGLVGGSIYKGTWNATTNTPTITSGVGTTGWYYIVSVPGSTNIDGITDWNLGDWIIFDGTVWQQVDNTDAVVSVNGYTGAVSLVSSDIPEGLTNLYYTPARARTAISLTTTGTSGAATYDNITGILNVPNYNPDLSGYVPYTGATGNVNLGTYNIAAGTGLIGPSASANFTRFPNALAVISNIPSVAQHNESLYIGLMVEGSSVGNTWGSGLYGAGYTNTTGSGRGTGVTGEGHVSASTDTGVAVGVRGYATDAHSGNYNIGLYGDAENGDPGLTYGGNVALFLANGNIVTSSAAAKKWYLGGNITFDGQGSTKVIGVTNGASFALGTVTSGVWNATAIADAYIASAATWNAKQAALSGTGFVKISGTTISYDNSTYLTTSAAASTYLAKTGGTLTGSLNGTSAVFSGAVWGQTGYFSNTTADNALAIFQSNASYHAVTITNSGVGGSALYVSGNSTFVGRVNVTDVLTAQAGLANGSGQSFTLPSTTGTLALTSDLASYVPTSRTLTINGTTYDLSANRSWTIASGVTSFNTRTGAITLTSGDVTGALGYTPYNSTNPSGYITGITSGMVTSALGYTPYNSSNPAGYITSSGSISGNAATATTATNLYGQGTIQRTSSGISYSTMIQVRETAGASGNSNIIYAPALGFHWGGVVASSIRMNAGGEIQIVNNPGTSYEAFRAGTITGDAISTPYYSGSVPGSSYGSIRVDGTTGGYAGIYLSGASGTVTGMYDTGGNGGNWDPTTGWHFYWHRGNTCLSLGGSTTSSSYRVYANGAMYVSGTLAVNSNLSAGGTITAGTAQGFLNSTYQAGYNRIWAFGNATGYGLGYWQGGTDYAGFHFGTTANPKFYFYQNGNATFDGYLSTGSYLRVNGNENLYLDYNYGCSVVGVYTSTRFQGIFAMGNAYKLAIDGSNTGNLYGLSWSHPNAGGQAGYLNDHGLLVMVAGTTYAAISSNIWARGNVSSNGAMYSNDWFRSYGNTGWYNQDYGQGLRQAKGNVTYGNVIVHGENFNGWAGYNLTNSTITNFMQNSSGTHGFYQENNAGWTLFWNAGYACWGMGTDATDPSYSLHITKYGGSNTGWIIWSDRRIKENIKTIDNALDKILSLRGVYYNKIDDPNKERCVGYIAQEVMEVVPELVVYSEELDIYNMNYAPMVAMLTEAIKEQQAQIEELKQQVQLLLNK